MDGRFTLQTHPDLVTFEGVSAALSELMTVRSQPKGRIMAKTADGRMVPRYFHTR